MMLVRTYVTSSPIEGLGVYAAEPIPRGTLIWSLDSRLDQTISLEELSKLPDWQQDFIIKYSFPHLNRPNHLVLEYDNGRFMNHTLSPNTDFTQFDKGWAIRDIAVGEELTCNYHEFDPTFKGFLHEARPNGNGHHAGIVSASP